MYWQELKGVKTLPHAQHEVDRIFGGLSEAEIWAARDGGIIRLIAKKDTEGKWGLVYDNVVSDDPPNFHYHLSHGARVSRKDFLKYGFRHEETQETI